MATEIKEEFHIKSEPTIDVPALEVSHHDSLRVESDDVNAIYECILFFLAASGDDRFVFSADNQWNNSVRAKCAPSTLKKMKFVVSLFNEWRRQRNLREPLMVPLKDVCDFTPSELNCWLPLFIMEIRRGDGGKYQPKSVLEFLLAIQSWITVEKNIRYSFLKEERFSSVKDALDTVVRDIQNESVGFDPQKADPITRRMEDELWSRGILSASSPRLLLRSLVYILGVRLGLRAGEHRLLRRNMFEVDPEAQFFTYTACSSENSPGSFDRKPKTVTVLKGEPDRCPVWYLQEYLTMTESVKSETAFYMRAVDVGFTKQVVGQHTLEKMVRDLMDEAGFPGRFTLHSLRMTFTARLHDHGFQETNMMGVTGRSSATLPIHEIQNVVVQQPDQSAHSSLSSQHNSSENMGMRPVKKMRLECGDLKIEFTF